MILHVTFLLSLLTSIWQFGIPHLSHFFNSFIDHYTCYMLLCLQSTLCYFCDCLLYTLTTWSISNSIHTDQDQDVLEAYDAAKEGLKEIYDLRGKEAIFRSRTKWIEEGEKPTKYFFNVERRNYEKKTILQVKLENSETTSDFKKVYKEIERFFSNMFTTKLADIPS